MNRSLLKFWVLPSVFACVLSLALSGSFSVRYIAAFVLLLVVPGAGIVSAFTPVDFDIVEYVVLSVTASYSTTIVATLLLHYIPGPPSLPLALTVYAFTALLPALLASRRPNIRFRHRGEWATLAALLGVLALAGFFLLTHLGVSEFQGDEAMALFDAGSAIRGDDVVLFYHRKGPAEILLSLAFWLLSGSINELTARIPFATAGLLAVASAFLLARRAFNVRIATVAAALLAVNGYFVGFSRIVQYQSLVMLSMTASILCFWLSIHEKSPRLQVLGALFLATGLLSHYDAAFALPVIAFLYLARLAGEFRHYTRELAVALVLAGVLLAFFYVPFLNSAYFTQTVAYLAFRSGERLLYNNLGLWWTTSTVYNSSYYVAFLALMGGVLFARGLIRHHCLSYAFFALLVIAVGTAVFSGAWQLGRYNLAFIPFVLFILIFFARWRNVPAICLALIWFAGPFLLYNFFFIKRPGTHFWTSFPGLVLLAAVGVDSLFVQLKPRRLATWAGAAAGVLMLAVFGYYTYCAFVRLEPEYRAKFPASKPSFYWTSYHRLPSQDFFGFPHRVGWKALGELYARGMLTGEYASNEGSEITAWYLRDAPRHVCRPDPRYYFLAESVTDPVSVTPEDLADFVERAQVTVGGKTGIRIFVRKDEMNLLSNMPQVIAVEELEGDFDRSRAPWDRLVQATQFIQTPLDVDFGGQARLIGYDLNTERACPGGELGVTLYWRQVGLPMPANYKTFVHLQGDRLLTQSDDVPGCGIWPTSTWRPDEVIVDRHVLKLPRDLPAAECKLLVGLYQPDNGLRLDVLDASGHPSGNSFTLRSLQLLAPCP